MTTLFDYPQKALFGRIIPKNKIYDHSGASKTLKNIFVSQVDKIIWAYKLAPETINIHEIKFISEIQIFEITLRTHDFKMDILQAIDKAIPFPILFECVFEDKIKMIAAFKRPNDADSTKWVISDYFASEWLPSNHQRDSLPITLNLGGLYKKLLQPLMPYPPRENEKLKDQALRIGLILDYEKQLVRLESKIAKEKQFNRQVDINADIRIIKQEIEKLT